jgi:hypothetical protein
MLSAAVVLMPMISSRSSPCSRLTNELIRRTRTQLGSWSWGDCTRLAPTRGLVAAMFLDVHKHIRMHLTICSSRSTLHVYILAPAVQACTQTDAEAAHRDAGTVVCQWWARGRTRGRTHGLRFTLAFYKKYPNLPHPMTGPNYSAEIYFLF